MENDQIKHIDPVREPAWREEFRIACKLTDRALEIILEGLHAGMTELQLLDRVIYAAQQAGKELAPGEKTAIGFIIIESGERTAMLHGRATDKVIKKGEFVTIDFGMTYRRAMADMTRTFVMGKASEEQRKMYNAVLHAINECEATIRPGMNGEQAHMIAQRVLDEEGYGDKFIHGLGHGFGEVGVANVADYIGLTVGCTETVLGENYIFTIEPGAYIEGFGGVRIEDTVILHKDGVEPLFSFTKELLEIND